MCSLKLTLGLALFLFVFVSNSFCKQLGHSAVKTTHGQNGSKAETKAPQQLESGSHNKDRKKTTTAHAKAVNDAHTKASAQQRTEKSTPTKLHTHQKSGIKTRSAENKEKKYSLSFSPNPQSTNDQQQDNNGFSQEQSNQQQYFSSPYGDQGPGADQSNQQDDQQQGYSMLNGGQNELSKFQGGNGEANENGQNIGMLQSLMEQRAAMYGQEEGNQDGEQRSYNQQPLASYQGQEQQNEEQQGQQQDEQQRQQQDEQQGQQQDEQQGQQQDEQQGQQQEEQPGQPQEDTQQYQQNMDRENAQAMNMQEGQGQEGQGQERQGQEGQVQEGLEGREGGQEFRLPQQDEEPGQQGSNQLAAYPQEGEPGDQQAGQMQEQQPSPEQQQQQGEAEGGFMMKEGGQEQSYKGGDDSREAYQKGGEDTREGYQQGGEEMQPPPDASLHGIDGGSIANIFGDANNQNGQDAQSLIREGQSITSSDAAQLAEAIANANKGLKGFKSLSSAASENSGALSFTGGEPPGLSPDKKEDNEAQGGNNMLFPETQSYSNEFPNSPPSKWSSAMGMEGNYDKGPEFGPEQEYHHEQQAYHEREDQPHFLQANQFEHQTPKYCTGCPRNSRCIDKVCIINGDEPLARILGALSGPENETDDCKGCHHHARCVKKECICKPGFNGNGTECKADSCLRGCSRHGKCIRGFCVCDHSHYFNGVECAPYKISQTECPQICKSQCLPHCPDKCCKTPTSPSTNGKKESSDTASAFFLKPSYNQAVDVFHKHPSHGKDIDQQKPTESSLAQMDRPNTTPIKTTSTVTPTTSRQDKPAQPSLKVNQMDFLKSIAEKFCPPQCQKNCNSGCPPVCCDKKTLASILTGSPGTSIVDMSKAEDVFRNAMGWFGMMNLIHMMYTMYGKNYKPNLGIKLPGTPSKNLVTPKPTPSMDTCSPICRKECLLSCPTSCCAANATKRTNSKPANVIKPVTAKTQAHPQAYQQVHPQARSQAQSRPQTYQPPIPQTYHPQKRPQAQVHLQLPKSETKAALGITRCPFVCSRQCLPLCPKSCCKLPTSKSIINTKRCKPGCSPKCYPQCSEYCCKALSKQTAISRTTQAQNRAISPLTHTCPAACPKRCYPSCTNDCCSSKYIAKSTENRGQYYVNIRCPNECRPFNCLSYCHHECCLRKNSISRSLKVKSLIASKPKKPSS